MANRHRTPYQPSLKLFLVSRDDVIGYDTYESFVVCASDIEEARNTHPSWGWEEDRKMCYPVWCDDMKHLSVKYLGLATGSLEKGIVCTSFKNG